MVDNTDNVGPAANHEPAPEPPKQAASALVDAIGRWITHWSFWPVYVVAITLVLAGLRPWQKWIHTASDAPARDPVHVLRLHSALPERAGMIDFHSVGAVIVVLNDADERDKNWLPCDGRLLSRSEYRVLFERIGQRFGSDRDKFRLPDYRGLTCVDPGTTEWSMTKALAVAAIDDLVASETAARVPVRAWIKAR